MGNLRQNRRPIDLPHTNRGRRLPLSRLSSICQEKLSKERSNACIQENVCGYCRRGPSSLQFGLCDLLRARRTCFVLRQHRSDDVLSVRRRRLLYLHRDRSQYQHCCSGNRRSRAHLFSCRTGADMFLQTAKMREWRLSMAVDWRSQHSNMPRFWPINLPRMHPILLILRLRNILPLE